MQTKEVQGKLWSAYPAVWIKYIEPTFMPIYRDTLNQLLLDEEKMLLDVGCGSGLFLSLAATTGAALQGIDAAPGLLANAKERLPGVPLLIEDLEDLPFIDGTFDVVTWFDSFQYAGNFRKALSEARRVVKRHGIVVIGAWCEEAICEASDVLKAIAGLLPAPPPGTAAPFALRGNGEVEAICQAVGLKLVRKDVVLCPWQFAGEEALQQTFLSTAPCVRAMQTAGGEAVKDAIAGSTEPYKITEEVYYLHNEVTRYITEKI